MEVSETTPSFPYSKKISLPVGKEGTLWNDFDDAVAVLSVVEGETTPSFPYSKKISVPVRKEGTLWNEFDDTVPVLGVAEGDTTPSFPYSKKISVPVGKERALWEEFVDELDAFGVALVPDLQITPYFTIAGEQDNVDLCYTLMHAWLNGVSLVTVKLDRVGEVVRRLNFDYHAAPGVFGRPRSKLVKVETQRSQAIDIIRQVEDRHHAASVSALVAKSRLNPAVPYFIPSASSSTC